MNKRNQETIKNKSVGADDSICLKEQQGITLIALIITIIVMLILVAVAVNTAVNSGLFGHAKNATTTWADSQRKESEIGNNNYIIDNVNEYTGNKKYDRKGIKIGDYVTYVPDVAVNYTELGTLETEKSGSALNPADGIPQDTSLKWRIMSVNEDGSVDLVSAKPIETTVYFKGALGFNNAVYLLNDLCRKQYSNKKLGIVARSINLSDIESKMSENGINEKNSYVNEGAVVNFGETYTYTEGTIYVPDIYKHVSKDTEGESQDYYNATTTNTYTLEESSEVRFTYYSLENISNEYFLDNNFCEVIFGAESQFWLATRYSLCLSGRAYHGLRHVNGTNISANALFITWGEGGNERK